jgi:hypothetical protein
VIASQQKEVFGVLNFEAKQEKYGLEALFPPVDIVAEEKVVGGGGEAAHLEESNEIRILAMDVADNLDRGRELDERGLVEKDLAGSETDGSNLCVL